MQKGANLLSPIHHLNYGPPSNLMVPGRGSSHEQTFQALEMTDFLVKNKLEQIVENFKVGQVNSFMSIFIHICKVVLVLKPVLL